MATSLSATEPLRAQGQAPADAAAIEKAVAAVAREIEHVKAQLYQTVNTHYGEFVSTVKSTGDLNAKVADVGRTVRLLAEQVDNTQVRPSSAASDDLHVRRCCWGRSFFWGWTRAHAKPVGGCADSVAPKTSGGPPRAGHPPSG